MGYKPIYKPTWRNNKQNKKELVLYILYDKFINYIGEKKIEEEDQRHPSNLSIIQVNSNMNLQLVVDSTTKLALKKDLFVILEQFLYYIKFL